MNKKVRRVDMKARNRKSEKESKIAKDERKERKINNRKMIQGRKYTIYTSTFRPW